MYSQLWTVVLETTDSNYQLPTDFLYVLMRWHILKVIGVYAYTSHTRKNIKILELA